jgi:hypothetical protein
VQLLQPRHDRNKALVVRLDIAHDRCGLAEEREREVEVGALDGAEEGFEEDVGDDFGVGEVGVELVAGALAEGAGQRLGWIGQWGATWASCLVMSIRSNCGPRGCSLLPLCFYPCSRTSFGASLVPRHPGDRA